MTYYYLTKSPEDGVLAALRREGGALSIPELTELTHLPPDMVREIVERLEKDQRVEFGGGNHALKVVRLQTPRTPWGTLMRWLHIG